MPGPFIRKIKNLFMHQVLFLLNHYFMSCNFQNMPELSFRQFFRLRMNADQPDYKTGRIGQQTYKRIKKNTETVNCRGNPNGYFFRRSQCDGFWYKFANYNRNKCDHQNG